MRAITEDRKLGSIIVNQCPPAGIGRGELMGLTTNHFTVVLTGLGEIPDDLAEALFEAGCDDG